MSHEFGSCAQLFMLCYLASEPITVGYDPDSYVTTETDGSVTLNIRVFSHPTTGAPRPFTLVFKTEDCTASMLPAAELYVLHNNTLGARAQRG